MGGAGTINAVTETVNRSILNYATSCSRIDLDRVAAAARCAIDLKSIKIDGYTGNRHVNAICLSDIQITGKIITASGCDDSLVVRVAGRVGRVDRHTFFTSLT